jgi:hypothetical protein
MSHSAVPSDLEFLESGFLEKLTEHVFVSELLQHAWLKYGVVVEISRAEVDRSGFDLVLEANGIARHVQLKSSRLTAKAKSPKVHTALAAKPSGCVVWIQRELSPSAHRLDLRFLFFGGTPGEPLQSLDEYRTARHTKANADGFKAERPNIKLVPKSAFEPIQCVEDLLLKLFGVLTPTDE